MWSAYHKVRRFPNFISFIRKTYQENYLLYFGLACPAGWVENGNQWYFMAPQRKEYILGILFMQETRSNPANHQISRGERLTLESDGGAG